MLVLGLSYKPDIDDVRESPAFKVIQLLEKKGATVDYHDPYVASIPDMRHYKLEKRQSIAFTAENLKQYDCVVLVTHHTAYDPEFLVANVPLLVDTRNVTKEMGKNNPKIKKA
jgi:UDP-N-acetyl-D-glucosamine dehydrogenase